MNSKYPDIRFQQFPEEWLSTTLSSIVEDVSGNGGRTGLPVLTISAARGWLTQEERFSQVIAGSELSNYTLLKRDELSYNKGNSKTAEYGVVFRLTNHELALVPKVYHSFRTTKKSDPFFIEKLFESKKPNQELMKIVTSGARMDGLLNINKNNFYSIKVIVPSKKEQTEIGEFFIKLDELIELQQLTIDNLKEMKKGFLQRMLIERNEKKPKLRIGDFSIQWRSKRLNEISSIVSGGTPSTKIKEYWDGTINWFTPGEIGKSVYEFESTKKITELGLQKSSAKLLPANRTILFTSRAGIGDMAILREESSTNQGFQSLVLYDDMEVYFIFSMQEVIKRKAIKNAAGSTFLEISGGELGKISILIPDNEEQKKIGEFFKKIDDLIELEQKELKSLKELKKGFLQKMFV